MSILRYGLTVLCFSAATVALQYDFWLGRNGFAATHKLEQQVTVDQIQNDQLIRRNKQWYAEILSLRQNASILEGMARENLGLIRKGEVFYQFSDSNEKLISLQEVKKK